MTNDTKDIHIAGCQVHLTYLEHHDGHWTVQGSIRCGTEDQANEQSVTTGPFPTREAAEQEALDQVGKLLGRNEDRSTSRVKNWS